MYGIFAYIYHTNEPNVGKYTIRTWMVWDSQWSYHAPIYNIYIYYRAIISLSQSALFLLTRPKTKCHRCLFKQVPLQSTNHDQTKFTPPIHEVWWVSQNWFLCVSVKEKKHPQSGPRGPLPVVSRGPLRVIGLFLTPVTPWFSAIKTGGPIRLITIVGATYVGSNNSLNAWPKAWVPRVLRWWGSPMWWVGLIPQKVVYSENKYIPKRPKQSLIQV